MGLIYKNKSSLSRKIRIPGKNYRLALISLYGRKILENHEYRKEQMKSVLIDFSS